MIDVVGLTKKFNDITAVEKITFQVKDGEIFGLLGPNGAGKTSTLRMLCCLISKTDGEAHISGYDTSNKEDSLKIRKIIGIVPENVGLYEELSTYRNLDFYGRVYHLSEAKRKERIEKYIDFLGLSDQRDRPVVTLSKGMKQKVAIARAIIHDPQVLFLDEPTANLDPEAAKTVRDFILQFKKEGKTILLNTHNLDEAQRICDKIGILKTKLLALGSPDELKRSLQTNKTVIVLGEINENIIAAVRNSTSSNIEIDGNKLTIDVKDSQNENPILIRAITAAGGNIESVNQLTLSMEDVYLRIVRERT